jgi:DNA helicase-2/ATP-dependent DNA helicase PcrA
MDDILTKLKNSKKNLFVGVAGPGTGKSTTFKLIVDSTEFKGKKILILSFINKLIDDLSYDFKSYTNVTVSTLHSFALKQLGEADLEQDLDRIVSEDYFFIENEKVDFEEKLHRNNLSDKEFNFYKERKNFYKHDKKLYSLTSIIFAANILFEQNNEKIPSGYDLILIDEFQDFNQLEFEFIKYLNQKSRTIVVGDDNQSLYDFKKAEPQLIRNLYHDDYTEEFSLDYCHRCTEVIVNAANDLLKNAKSRGFLTDGLDKKFLYPEGRKEKDELSKKYPLIDFFPVINGDQLIYKIKQDIEKNTNNKEKKRILILVPSFLKQTIYYGMIKNGFNVIEYEIFREEKHNKIKHKDIIDTFNTLSKRKTDNISLRKILNLYLTEEGLKQLILTCRKEGKKIWNLLSNDVKTNIENDIKIFKKAKVGKFPLDENELLRFNQIFNLKNIISRTIKGFLPIAKDSIEVEMTTVTSSKGISADYVYYIGIDDKVFLDKNTQNFSDHSLCEFFVGITRAKEKLTLISQKDENPQILSFLDKKLVRRVKI